MTSRVVTSSSSWAERSHTSATLQFIIIPLCLIVITFSILF